MRMPGFAAATSLYKTKRSYRTIATGGGPVPGVVPQSRCGECDCPGTCCVKTLFGCECKVCRPGFAEEETPESSPVFLTE